MEVKNLKIKIRKATYYVMEQEKDVVGRIWILNKIVYIATFLRSEIGIQHAVKLFYIIECKKPIQPEL